MVKKAMFWSMVLGVGAVTALSAGSVRAEETEGQAPQKDTAWYVQKYDTDGDGQLSDAERESAKAAWKEKQAKRDLERFDKDGDGQLSDAEKGEADAARAARKQKMLEKFDKDGDGKLSEEERAEMTKHWADHKGKNNHGDEDGDEDADEAKP